MSFVYPLPWWLAVLLAAAIAGVTYAEYRRPLAPLSPGQRALLAGCRAITLALLALFLFRPIVVTPGAVHGAIVPVLVDRSLSMRLTDEDGQSRLGRAASLLSNQLVPSLSANYVVEVFGIGDRVERMASADLRPDARKSDLRGALASIRDRYRGQPVAGIVLLTDGGETSEASGDLPGDWPSGGPPVFAIGLGAPDGLRDRAIAGITAGEQRLDQTTVDVHVTAAAQGFGRAPFVLRLLADGREIEARRVAPKAEGAPIEEVFTVAPAPAAPTVYTAEIPADGSEPVAENNTRSVLINPAGRPRRLLMIEGGPGYEHSFVRRAWQRDPALEVDAVGRKGKSIDGRDTFFIQSSPVRAAALTTGFPARREDLYAYDAVVLADVEGDFLTRAQLAMIAEFVSERGGGLLVAGGRSFSPRGLAGTPLDEALPVDVSERRGGRTAAAAADRPATNRIALTADGEGHPVMRIGATPEETRRLWAALPALASAAPLGGPRRGAAVLAVTAAPTGVVYPAVAVQRYGRGRSMIFAGEASWRWRMLMPSTDRSFERFWRQAARWLAGASPDAVSLTLPDGASAGDQIEISGEVRDASFQPVGDAEIDAAVTAPDGQTQPIKPRRSAAAGAFTASLRLDAPGLYRVSASAKRANIDLGTAVRWLYAGGDDREFADPRLNEAWLRRIARTTGGRYVRAAGAANVPGWLQPAAAREARGRRDLWHEPASFIVIVGLLSAEWIVRRRWGLR